MAKKKIFISPSLSFCSQYKNYNYITLYCSFDFIQRDYKAHAKEAWGDVSDTHIHK